MGAIVAERECAVRLSAGVPFDRAVLTCAQDSEDWLAVAIASATHRNPHYVSATRFLNALRNGDILAEGAMAEFMAMRPDILQAKAIAFSTFPNKDKAARRFVRAVTVEACRVTDYCDKCLNSPGSCACSVVECTRCGRKFRIRDARTHECVDIEGNRWVGGLTRP